MVQQEHQVLQVIPLQLVRLKEIQVVEQYQPQVEKVVEAVVELPQQVLLNQQIKQVVLVEQV